MERRCDSRSRQRKTVCRGREAEARRKWLWIAVIVTSLAASCFGLDETNSSHSASSSSPSAPPPASPEPVPVAPIEVPIAPLEPAESPGRGFDIVGPGPDHTKEIVTLSIILAILLGFVFGAKWWLSKRAMSSAFQPMDEEELGSMSDEEDMFAEAMHPLEMDDFVAEEHGQIARTAMGRAVPGGVPISPQFAHLQAEAGRAVSPSLGNRVSPFSDPILPVRGPASSHGSGSAAGVVSNHSYNSNHVGVGNAPNGSPSDDEGLGGSARGIPPPPGAGPSRRVGRKSD